MSPPDCRNSKILPSGVPTVDLRLSPVLSRNFHLAFLLGACHTMESHLFWEEARPLFPTTKAESLTLAGPGTSRLHRPFPVWTANAELSVPARKFCQRPELTLVHSQPILSSSFGIPAVPRAQWQGSWGGKPPWPFCTVYSRASMSSMATSRQSWLSWLLFTMLLANSSLHAQAPHDASSPLNQSTALQIQFVYPRDKSGLTVTEWIL